MTSLRQTLRQPSPARSNGPSRRVTCAAAGGQPARDPDRAPGAPRARGLRHQRGHAAGARGARGTDADRRGAGTHLGTPPGIREVSVAPPGFINLRLDPAWVAGSVAAIREGGPVRARARGRAASDQRRVRQRQPDRAADRGNAAARSWATCSAACWRRSATRSRASTTSTTTTPRSATWASPSWPATRARGAGGRLPRRLRQRAGGAGAG